MLNILITLITAANNTTDVWAFTGTEGYEDFMGEVYTQVEEATGLYLEVSVKSELKTGRVDAYTEGGNVGCKKVAVFDYEKEAQLVYNTVKNITGEVTEEVVTNTVNTIAQAIEGWVK